MRWFCLALLLGACDDSKQSNQNPDLTMPAEDLAVAADLASSIDLAGADFSGVDLSVVASGDLASADLSPASGSATYLYLSSGTAMTIEGRSIDLTTGAAAAIDQDTGAPGVQSSVPAGDTPQPPTVAPNGKFLYVANYIGNTIGVYQIAAATGRLTHFDADPVTGGVQDIATGTSTNPQSIVVDPSSSYAFVAENGADKVAAFSINGTSGALTPFASPSPAPVGTRFVTMDPSGSLLFAVAQNPAAVAVYTVSGGTLTQVDQDSGTVGVQAFTALDTGPLYAVVHPQKRILYVVAFTGPKIDTLSFTAGGVLSAVDSDTVAASPLSAAIDPTGQYIYVPSFGTTKLSGFSVAADGSLTAIADTTVATSSGRGVFFDPSGALLFLKHDGSSLESFHFNAATGALTAATSSLTMGSEAFQSGMVHVTF